MLLFAVCYLMRFVFPVSAMLLRSRVAVVHPMHDTGVNYEFPPTPRAQNAECTPCPGTTDAVSVLLPHLEHPAWQHDAKPAQANLRVGVVKLDYSTKRNLHRSAKQAKAATQDQDQDQGRHQSPTLLRARTLLGWQLRCTFVQFTS